MVYELGYLGRLCVCLGGQQPCTGHDVVAYTDATYIDMAQQAISCLQPHNCTPLSSYCTLMPSAPSWLMTNLQGAGGSRASS